jgi:dipeptidyl aminopeptidase/acylaminoacyl peptidase
LTWYGRDGKSLGLVGAADSYELSYGGPVVRISPSGMRIAFTRREAARRGDIWLIDPERGVTTRLTRNNASNAIWSPDGQRVAYARNAPPNIFVKNVDGTGQEERLTESGNSQQLCDWSPDGRFVLYSELPNELGAQTHSALWLVSVTGERKPMPVLQAPFGETNGRFSPDGNWIAYTSDESGSKEIYVQRFTSDGAKVHVSARGGDLAVWRKDGRELFYISPGGMLMSVAVSADGAAPRFGTPAPLFNIGISYDVSADGQRFLALTPVDEREASPMTVVSNWQALLNK